MVTFSFLKFLNCAPRGSMEYKRLSEMNGFVTWHENGGQLVFQPADCQLEWYVSKPVIHSYLNTHWPFGPLDAGPRRHIHNRMSCLWAPMCWFILCHVLQLSNTFLLYSSHVIFFLPFTEYIIIYLRSEWEAKSYVVKICLRNWPL